MSARTVGGTVAAPLQARVEALAPPDGARLWTPESVQAEIGRAYRVLSRVGGRIWPAGYQGWWPDMQGARMDYPDAELRPRAGAPAPSEISRAEVAVTWPLLIPDARDRKVVIARCLGAKYRKLERLDGRTRETLRKYVGRGLALITAELNDRLDRG